MKIHTGSGTDTARNLYGGRGRYVWNNTGDRAVLRNANGTFVDRCAWTGSGSATTC